MAFKQAQANSLRFNNQIRALPVSALPQIDCQANELSHGPREWCSRARAHSQTNSRLLAIPDLLGDHSSVIGECHQCVESFAGQSAVAARQIVFASLACQKRP